MNFNASRNLNQGGGIRKAKRVSDVSAVGAPLASPAYSPSPVYDPGFVANINSQPQEAHNYINKPYEYSQSTPMHNEYGFGGGGEVMPPGPAAPSMFPQSPAQLGAVFQEPFVQGMAMQYGQQLANQGKEIVNREFEKYVPVSKLKYYFAVDTRYVVKKLLLIFFPFTHKEWTLKYDHDNPVQPRYEINAPDLYIPTMAYVTYILVAGFMLGMQHKFSPEQIGIQASSALAYIVFEMILYLITLYITNINTNLKTLDLLAYSGYKYAVMIACLSTGLIFKTTGYYAAFAYCSFALAFFLVRTLKTQVLAGAQTAENINNYGYSQNPYAQTDHVGGSKRRAYFLLFVAILQPLLSWWLTHHLVPSNVVLTKEPLL